MSDRLRSDHPASVRESLLSCLSPSFWTSLGSLEDSIRTGRTAFETVHGKPFFEWLAANAGESNRFSTAMNAATAAAVPAILRSYDFSRFRCAVDIGGGHGALLFALLSAYPMLQGILFDSPEVIARITGVRFPFRCRLTGGDFFADVPAGGDLYVLRAILHDWEDAPAIRLLQNCRRAMGSRGTLLVIEDLLQTGSQAEMLDLHMLILTGGRERTLPQYQSLLSRSGFRYSRTIPLGGLAILEFVPA